MADDRLAVLEDAGVDPRKFPFAYPVHLNQLNHTLMAARYCIDLKQYVCRFFTFVLFTDSDFAKSVEMWPVLTPKVVARTLQIRERTRKDLVRTNAGAA